MNSKYTFFSILVSMSEYYSQNRVIGWPEGETKFDTHAKENIK